VRRLICILLLFCLPLHSFAMQDGALLFGGAGENSIVHEFEHDERVEHHHDDNGSVHYDDSDESVQHIQDPSSSPQPAYLTGPYLPIAPLQLASAVNDAVVQFIPTPFLDSPLRPPAPFLG
jgi:hypothetical protein